MTTVPSFAAWSRPLLGLGALALATFAAGEARATYFVPDTQAGVINNATDGKCSLWEAIDSINKGHTGPGTGLHGCKNQDGGSDIELVGNNDPTKAYKSGGIEIKKSMNIYAYAPFNWAYIEHNKAFTFKIAAGASVYISGFEIRHIGGTGSTAGRVIENHGSLLLDGVHISGGDVRSASTTAPARYGGGIYNAGALDMYYSIVRNNKAGKGGGIYTTGVNGTLMHLCTVHNNTANEEGGGIYNNGRLFSDTNTISTNTATGRGGGIYFTSGTNAYCELQFNTVAFNKASEGGGVFANTSKTITMSSIVARNWRSNGTTPDDYKGNPHGSNSIDKAAPYHSLFGVKTGIPNADTLQDKWGNPNLGGLADNFGVTPTHAIPSNSIAKDAILPKGSSPLENTYCSVDHYDQRVSARLSGPRCDFGAYELQQ